MGLMHRLKNFFCHRKSDRELLADRRLDEAESQAEEVQRRFAPYLNADDPFMAFIQDIYNKRAMNGKGEHDE